MAAMRIARDRVNLFGQQPTCVRAARGTAERLRSGAQAFWLKSILLVRMERPAPMR
jgi:hypothetical protein